MVQVDNKEMFIYSVCPPEILHVSYDEGDTCLAFYSYGRKDNKTSWKYRLRHIWRIIKFGTPFDDEVTLDETGRTMLMDTLKNHGVSEPIIKTYTSTTKGD